MRGKVLLVINTINVVLFVIVLLLFLNKYFSIDEESVAGNIVVKINEAKNSDESNIITSTNSIKLEEEVKKKENQKEIDRVIEELEAKLNDGDKELVKELVNTIDNVVINMSDHSKDKFVWRQFVSKGKYIQLFNNVGQSSKLKLKPGSKILASTTNYGEYTKILFDEKAYLVKSVDLRK